MTRRMSRRAPGQPQRLMLVDDEEIDRRLCARLLRRCALDAELVGYGNAAEALAHLADPARPPVDAILLDVNMPGIDAFGFLDRLDALDAPWIDGVPVFVLLTTPLPPARAARARACPRVRGFLEKPLDLASLMTALGDAAHLPTAVPRVAEERRALRS